MRLSEDVVDYFKEMAKEPLGNERSWRAPDFDLCLMNILNADRT